MEHVEVAVVGAGQAGLSLSHELTSAGIEHVVLERHRIAEAWRRRWDSFCLVTPNWTVQLPGLPYDGDDPDGFMVRDEIVSHMERYARTFAAPVREGVGIEAVRRTAAGSFELETTSGAVAARTVVIATGAYQRPHRVPGAEGLPPGLLQLDLQDYRNPDELPAGKVLVIGSGQSGVQIAEELHEAGRRVYLSCGRAPWFPRRLGGRDLVWWLLESRFMEQPLESLPSPAARFISNPLTSGHGGGHDLHLRTLHAMGVTLTGRFTGASGGEARFAPDLAESVAWGDARYHELMDLFRKFAAERGLEEPQTSDPEPFDPEETERLDLSDFGAVIFTAGFRPDYGWLPWPEALDAFGFPLQSDGESSVIRGLFFLGVHFLRRRKSALLCGVGEDATVVAARIAGRRQRRAS